MGGKASGSTGTQYQTQATQIPAEVLARYNSVNARAEETAQNPFQNYGGEFVAPVNQQQWAGIGAISDAGKYIGSTFSDSYNAVNQGLGAAAPWLEQAGQGYGQALNYGQGLNAQALGTAGGAYGNAQPYNTVANNALLGSGMATMAGMGAVDPNSLDIQGYMSPYNEAVVQSTMNLLGQQQARDRNALTTQQIQSGTFGGDRSGIGKAVLQGQQNLTSANVASGLYNQNYMQALNTAQQQQQVGLGAAQANRAAIQQGAGQLQGLGAAQAALGQQVYGQGMGLAGFQGQIGQQGYGQALGAAQAQQGLGAAQYGMYSNAGQMYNAIGTQALQNQMNWGQAQLGAGTLVQQTQQAQDQAMYNQWLQQQAYPFQVTQYLANIAMGTGALSGSTTQGSSGQFAPMSYFGGDTARSARGGRVGHARGGVANDNSAFEGFASGGGLGDVAQILALHQAMYPGAGGRPGLDGTGPRGMKLDVQPPRQLMTPKLDFRTPQKEQESGLRTAVSGANDAVGLGKSAASLYGMGKDALVGAPAGKDTPETGGLIGRGGKYSWDKGWLGRQTGSGDTGGGLGDAANSVRANAITKTELPPLPSTPANEVAGNGVVGADTASAAADAASTAADTATDVSQVAEAIPTAELIDAATLLAARGGRMKRAAGGAGGGGMPYGDAAEGYIPDELYAAEDPNALAAKQKELAPKLDWGKSGGSGSTGSGMKGMGKAAGALAGAAIGSIIPGVGTVIGGLAGSLAGAAADAAMKRGGRAGYREGGEPVDDALLPQDNVIALEVPKREPGLKPPTGEAGVVVPLKRDDIDTKGTGRYVDTLPSTTTTSSPSTTAPASVPATPGLAPQAPAPTPAPSSAGLAPPAATPSTAPGFDSPEAVAKRHWVQESGDRQWDAKGNLMLSSVGAVGRSQLYDAGPGAAKLAGVEWDPNRARTDEQYNRLLGDTWLKHLTDKYQDPYKATAAYNAGTGGVEKAEKTAALKGGEYWQYLPAETQNHLYVVSGGKIGRPAGGAEPGLGGAKAVALNAPAADQGPNPGFAPAGTGGLNPPKDRDFLDRAGDWYDRNERYIIPAMSFLGSMLSSRSRNLTGAVGAGLMGAAGALGQQQGIGQRQQTIDIQKNAQLITIWNQLKQMYANQIATSGKADPDLLAQMNRIGAMIGQAGGSTSAHGAPEAPGGMTPVSGAGGPPGGPQLPAGGPPQVAAPGGGSPVQTAQLPAPAPAGGVSAPNADRPNATGQDELPPSMRAPTPSTSDAAYLRQLDPQFNPQELMRRAQAIQGTNSAEAGRLMDRARQIQIEMQRSGYGTGPDGVSLPIPNKPEIDAYNQRIQTNPQTLAGMQAAYTQRQVMRSNVDKIVDIMQRYEPGRLNELKGDLQALGNSLGLKVPDTATTSAASFQIFMKEAAQAIIGNATGDQRTDAARELIGKAFATPNLEPKAVRSILAQTKGNIDWADDFYNDVVTKHQQAAGINIPLRASEFNKTQPLESYIKKHDANIAVRGALPDKFTQQDAGRVYIMTPNEMFERMPKGATMLIDGERKPITLDMIRKSDWFGGNNGPRRFRIGADGKPVPE